MKLRKIKVYGSLRKFLKRTYFEAAVDSPKDAIKFLVCNFPKVEKHLNEQIYKIKMGGVQVWKDDLGLSGEGDIQFIPVAIGAGPVVAIIGGVLAAGAAGSLLAGAGSAKSSAVNPGAGAVFDAAQGLAQSGFVADAAKNVLASTAVTGVASLLTPDQSIDSPETSSATGAGAGAASADPENSNSFASLSFNQIVNVSVSGGAVPIIYGEVFTGSIVISASTDVQQVISS
jgi:predicted phage tail protein